MKRKHIQKYWEHSNLHKSVEELAMKRILGITGVTTNNNDNDSEDSSSIDDNNWMHAEINRHSRGNARPTQTFYDAFGIHAVAKKLKITCAILWNLGACINCLQNF